MISITVEKNFGPLAELELFTAEDMRQVGLLLSERIIRRTLSGVDVDGAPFRAYSPGYAKAKSEALGVSNVNLQVSGNMLNQLGIVDVRVTKDEASVTLGWST